MNMLRLEKALTTKFGWDWDQLEHETISLEIGAVFDVLTQVQITILKAIHLHHDILLHDVDYFLRFIEVANSNIPDPQHHDIPTSLELDLALRELVDICMYRKLKVDNTSMLTNVIRYILNNEGHGKAASPMLAKYGQLPKVKTEFSHAYEQYASEMGG